MGLPFNITHFYAVNIAIGNKFKSGIYPWIVRFDYDFRDEKYYWIICNNLDKYSGEYLYIDPASGDIVKKHIWIS